MLESWKKTEYFKECFTIPKSGEFKGKVTTKWHRDNCGWAGIKCPQCDGWIHVYKSDYENKPCECGWEKDRSGFRFRYVLKGVENVEL